MSRTQHQAKLEELFCSQLAALNSSEGVPSDDVAYMTKAVLRKQWTPTIRTCSALRDLVATGSRRYLHFHMTQFMHDYVTNITNMRATMDARVKDAVSYVHTALRTPNRPEGWDCRKIQGAVFGLTSRWVAALVLTNFSRAQYEPMTKMIAIARECCGIDYDNLMVTQLQATVDEAWGDPYGEVYGAEIWNALAADIVNLLDKYLLTMMRDTTIFSMHAVASRPHEPPDADSMDVLFGLLGDGFRPDDDTAVTIAGFVPVSEGDVEYFGSILQHLVEHLKNEKATVAVFKRTVMKMVEEESNGTDEATRRLMPAKFNLARWVRSRLDIIIDELMVAVNRWLLGVALLLLHNAQKRNPRELVREARSRCGISPALLVPHDGVAKLSLAEHPFVIQLLVALGEAPGMLRDRESELIVVCARLYVLFDTEWFEKWDGLIVGYMEKAQPLGSPEPAEPEEPEPEEQVTTDVDPLTIEAVLQAREAADVTESDLEYDPDECVICQDSARTHIAIPCGHFHYCEECSREMSVCAICSCDDVVFYRVYQV